MGGEDDDDGAFEFEEPATAGGGEALAWEDWKGSLSEAQLEDMVRDDAAKDPLSKFKRGKKELWEKNMVRRLEGSPGSVTAAVRGSDPDPYLVKITFESRGSTKETKCSCPDGERTHGKCKHVVAVLLQCLHGPPADSAQAAPKSSQAKSLLAKPTAKPRAPEAPAAERGGQAPESSAPAASRGEGGAAGSTGGSQRIVGAAPGTGGARALPSFLLKKNAPAPSKARKSDKAAEDKMQEKKKPAVKRKKIVTSSAEEDEEDAPAEPRTKTQRHAPAEPAGGKAKTGAVGGHGGGARVGEGFGGSDQGPKKPAMSVEEIKAHLERVKQSKAGAAAPSSAPAPRSHDGVQSAAATSGGGAQRGGMSMDAWMASIKEDPPAPPPKTAPAPRADAGADVPRAAGDGGGAGASASDAGGDGIGASDHRSDGGQDSGDGTATERKRRSRPVLIDRGAALGRLAGVGGGESLSQSSSQGQDRPAAVGGGSQGGEASKPKKGISSLFAKYGLLPS